MGVNDRIQELEERLANTPKNKGTETARAQLKAQIAKLKEEQEQQGGSGGGTGYGVKHRGDATVCMVGPPSVGKTSLLNRLTGVEKETASYEFTTVSVNPGMMQVNGASIQLLDVPGIIGGAAEGRGGGKQVLSVVRDADLLLLVTDVEHPAVLEAIREELREAGIHVNETRPDVSVEEKDRGGLQVNATVNLENREALEEALAAYGFVNAAVTVREKAGVEDVLAAVSPSTVYVPAIPVVNKADTLTGQSGARVDAVYTSAETGENLDVLRERIWDRLGLTHLFLKEPGKEASDDPLIMETPVTVGDVAAQVKRGGGEKLRHARVWGESADFAGQQVGGTHRLTDGDTVELRF